MKCNEGVPKGWLQTPKFGYIAYNLFFPLKTPLDSRFDEKIPKSDRFDTHMLRDFIKKNNIILLVDLTEPNRYYNPEDVRGVKYIKIRSPGDKGIPSLYHTKKFSKAVNSSLDNKSNGTIAVHCVNGYNKTGFMIVEYLIRVYDFRLRNALKVFANARPPGIYKTKYLERLHSIYDPKLRLDYPRPPKWVQEFEKSKETSAGIRSTFDINSKVWPKDIVFPKPTGPRDPPIIAIKEKNFDREPRQCNRERETERKPRDQNRTIEPRKETIDREPSDRTRDRKRNDRSRERENKDRTRGRKRSNRSKEKKHTDRTRERESKKDTSKSKSRKDSCIPRSSGDPALKERTIDTESTDQIREKEREEDNYCYIPRSPENPPISAMPGTQIETEPTHKTREKEDTMNSEDNYCYKPRSPENPPISVMPEIKVRAEPREQDRAREAKRDHKDLTRNRQPVERDKRKQFHQEKIIPMKRPESPHIGIKRKSDLMSSSKGKKPLEAIVRMPTKKVKPAPKFYVQIPSIEPILDLDEIQSVISNLQTLLQTTIYGFLGHKYKKLTKQTFGRYMSSPCYHTWQTNGKRYLLYIVKENEIYFIDEQNNYFKVLNTHFPHPNFEGQHITDTVLDGEIVIDTNGDQQSLRYLISDLYALGGGRLYEPTFTKRLGLVVQFIIEPRTKLPPCDLKNESFSILVKTISAKEYILQTWENLAPNLPHGMTGLVFYPYNDISYTYLTKAAIFLWEPFEIKYVKFKLKAIMDETEKQWIAQLYVRCHKSPYSFIKFIPEEMKNVYDNKIARCHWDIETNTWKIMPYFESDTMAISKWDVGDDVNDFVSPLFVNELMFPDNLIAT